VVLRPLYLTKKFQNMFLSVEAIIVLMKEMTIFRKFRLDSDIIWIFKTFPVVPPLLTPWLAVVPPLHLVLFRIFKTINAFVKKFPV
jgi:hypothetical protein